MRIKAAALVLSLLTAIFFMSGGYGRWEKTLIIRGTIEVAAPETADLEAVGTETLPLLSEPPPAQITGSEDTETGDILPEPSGSVTDAATPVREATPPPADTASGGETTETPAIEILPEPNFPTAAEPATDTGTKPQAVATTEEYATEAVAVTETAVTTDETTSSGEAAETPLSEEPAPNTAASQENLADPSETESGGEITETPAAAGAENAN